MLLPDLPRRSILTAMAVTAAGVIVAPLIEDPASAAQAAITPNVLGEAAMINILTHPDTASFAAYAAKDGAGNAMESPSIMQLVGAAYKYAAVYHTPYVVTGGWHYKVNLAGSNDLINWTFIRTLMDNADMPKILRVTGSTWIVVTHEQWSGPGPTSTAPSNVAFRLFYTDTDLLNGTIASTYTMPMYGPSQLNGTPSFYAANLVLDTGYYSVDGQYGFHDWDGTRDSNDVTTITRMFDPRPGKTTASPSTATAYNNKFIVAGVTGNIGQRDTIDQPFGRYNLQEGNIGLPGGSWDKWRLWLYKYTETTAYPTGAGTVTQLSPVTPHGSFSFGNPSVRIVDAPGGAGQVMWVSYFLFKEGAGLGEEGSLIYWTNI